MSGAQSGLRKALARAGSSVLTIAEMQTEDLLAEMTDDQRTALAAALAPAAAAGSELPAKKKDPNCSEDGDEDDKGGDSDPNGKPGSEASAPTPALAADSRIKAVAAAVASDGVCKGKAELALSMLADDDYAGLNASGIVKLLGKAPATAVASTDPEAAARAEMTAALDETTNSNVSTDTGTTKSSDGNHANLWKQAIASNNPGVKLG